MQTAPVRPVRQPILNLPLVTRWLLLANLVIHAVLSVVPSDLANSLTINWGFVPARFVLLRDFSPEAVATLLSYQFLHGSWLHVGLNMAMLAAFGSGVERALGPWRMLSLYLVTGILAAIGHMALFPQDLAPVVGASGAISGLFGCVLLLMRLTGRMAHSPQQFWILVAVWVGIGMLDALGSGVGGESIAWAAHAAGFLAGIGLTPLWLRRWR